MAFDKFKLLNLIYIVKLSIKCYNIIKLEGIIIELVK